MNKDLHIFNLSNGLRVVYGKWKNTQLVHTGLIARAGSRDENDSNNGIAHFIEHAVFKGTKRRKAFQIFNRIESVGGEINAYTTRENTAFYTSSLKKHFERGLDLLADMTFNSVFDPRELDKEKKVIYEEIEMYNDSPEDSIYDDFYARMFHGQPMGFNILGTRESLAQIVPEQMFDFIKTKYAQPNLVLSLCGNLQAHKVEKLCAKYFEHIPLLTHATKRAKAKTAAPFYHKEEKDFIQTHCIIGCPAYDRYHAKRYIFMVLNNLLGGNSMGSRLNLSVREKRGYTYSINSSYSTYDDTGMFCISFACDDKNLNKTIKVVKSELKKLREKPLGSVQLTAAKRQLQGQLAMYSENPSAMMQANGKGILNFDHVLELPEVFDQIEKVTANDILQAANELLFEENLSTLIYTSK